MRPVSLLSMLASLVLAMSPSGAQSQGMTVSPAYPLPGQAATFQLTNTACGGDWLLNGTGPIAGYSTLAGPSIVVDIPPGADYAGTYQMTMDPGVSNPPMSHFCNYSTVTFTIPGPGMSTPTGLSGLYTFQCHGHQPANQGGGMSAAVGSFSADGAGTLTSGIFDFNSVQTTLTAQALTGTYSVDSGGTGQVTVKTPLGTAHYDAVLNPAEIAGGMAANSAILVERDSQGPASSCTLSLVAPKGATPQLPGSSFLFYGPELLHLSGEAASSGSSSSTSEILGSTLLSLNDDQSASAVTYFAGAVGLAEPLTLTGVYSTGTQNVRAILGLTGAGESSSQPTHFAIYPTNQQGSSVYLLSIDPHASYSLLIGTPTHSGQF